MFHLKGYIYLSIFYLPIHLNPRGGRQTGIPEYQVLRGLVEIKDRKGGEMSLYSARRSVSIGKR